MLIIIWRHITVPISRSRNILTFSSTNGQRKRHHRTSNSPGISSHLRHTRISSGLGSGVPSIRCALRRRSGGCRSSSIRRRGGLGTCSPRRDHPASSDIRSGNTGREHGSRMRAQAGDGAFRIASSTVSTVLRYGPDGKRSQPYSKMSPDATATSRVKKVDHVHFTVDRLHIDDPLSLNNCRAISNEAAIVVRPGCQAWRTVDDICRTRVTLAH